MSSAAFWAVDVLNDNRGTATVILRNEIELNTPRTEILPDSLGRSVVPEPGNGISVPAKVG